MKKSEYILSKKYNNQLIVMPLVTKDILVIEESEIDDFYYSLENFNDKSSKYFKELCSSGLIIKDEISEIDILKKIHFRSKVTKNMFTITVIPTFSCNLKCSYCYESNMNFSKLNFDENDWNELYLFIQKITKKGIKYITINFYGGEPTLKSAEIEKFINKIRNDTSLSQNRFKYSISTNLHRIDDSFMDFMANNNFERVDTTIAGLENCHNFLRASFENSENAYRNVLKNIKKIIMRNIKVCICINVSRLNYQNLNEIITNIVNELGKNKIYFSFLKIFNYANCHCHELIIDDKLYQEKIIETMKFCLDRDINIMDLSCFDSEGLFCGAYMNNSISIAPGGLVFKCTEQFSPENSYGLIKDGEEVVTNRTILECKNCFTVEKCISCKYLPYCFGGCLESERRGRSSCPSEINYLDEYLELYYRKMNKGGE